MRLVLDQDGKVHQILRITGLDRAYEIFGDRAGALAGWTS